MGQFDACDRIFILSNPLSALIAHQITLQYPVQGDTYFLIDHGSRKKSFIAEIRLLLPADAKLFNLGNEIADEADLKVGLRKRVTRRVKRLPLVKTVYNQFYKKAIREIENSIEEKINQIFKEKTFGKVELFLLTQTYANPVLIRKFPTAIVNYYEHGIGDYVLVSEKTGTDPNSFYGVFAKEYSEWKKDQSGIHFQSVDFPLKKSVNAKRTKVIIIFQNLEIYNLGIEFWQSYFGDIQSRLDPTDELILKFHPLQSESIIQFTRNYFSQTKLKYSEIENSNCIETEFMEISGSVKMVFSPFSSSLFYLSKFFQNDEIEFQSSIGRVSNRLHHAPIQYREQFEKSLPAMMAVFGVLTKEF